MEELAPVREAAAPPSGASRHPPSLPAARLAWWTTAVLLITALVSYSDRLVLSVLVDPLRSELQLTDSAVGVLQGPAFTLVYVFTSLIFGRLADRRSRRALLLAGVAIWCAAMIGCALAGRFETFLGARIVLGIGEAALVPTAISLIADSFPASRLGTPIGVFAMGTVIGGPLGISIGGLLLTAAGHGVFHGWPLIGALSPWRQVLFAMGTFGLILPALLYSFPEPGRQGTAEPVPLGAAARYFRSDARILLPLYLGMGLLSIGDYGLVGWAPTVLSRLYRWPADHVGLAFGVVTAIAGVAGSLLAGWLSDRVERRGGTRARATLSAAGALAAAAAALLFCTGHAALALAGLGLWTFCSTIGGISGICTLQEHIPGAFRATSMSLVTFGNTLIGLGCGPTLVGFTTDHVFRATNAVSLAIATVAIPAGLLACAGFARTRRALSFGR